MAETRKTTAADLESKRGTGFLLGLIVALALGFAALEYTLPQSDEDMDEELLEDIAQDMEQLPALDQKDMVAAVQPQQVAAVSQQVQEVKADVQQEQAAEAPAAAAPKALVPVEVPPDITEELMKVPPMPLDLDDNPLKLRVVENTPEPSIGWIPFMKWLSQSLKYPPTAKVQKIQGTVFVTFIVNVDGSVSEVTVKKSVEPSLDREALRVVNMMPKWNPGVTNGKPARAMIGIPIVFKL
jgi:protein TonB